MAVKHVQIEPPPLAGFRPDLPPDLCAIVHKMMAKKPDDRYQSAKDVLRDLARLRESMSGVFEGFLTRSVRPMANSMTRLSS